MEKKFNKIMQIAAGLWFPVKTTTRDMDSG